MAYSQYDPAFNPAPPPILRFPSGKPDAPEPVISPYATGYTQPGLTFGNDALLNGDNFLTSVFTGAFGGGFPLSGTPVSSWDGAFPVAPSPTPGTPVYPSTADGGAASLDWVQGLASSVMGALGIGGDQQTSETLIPVSQPQSAGIDTTTMLLIGGAGVLAFLLLKKG